jgi:hypothetical protein
MMPMTSRQAAIRAKGKTSKRTGTVRVARTADPLAKRNTLQKKALVPPFTDGILGLGVLSVPPKPVKR